MRRRAALLLCLLVTAVLAAACGGPPAAGSATEPRRGAAKADGARHESRPIALARRYGAAGTDAVPILVYHVIAAAPAGTPYPELWTPPDRFAAQMKALRRAGFHGVTLSDVIDHWRRGLMLPKRPVVVSFDDGYASQLRSAAPVLRRLRWPGVLYLEVHDMSVAGGLRPRDVRRLLSYGWELGSHTLTHPDLTTLGGAELERELRGSRRVLRRRFGVPVATFCYPAGRVDATVAAATRAAGYRAATTTRPGVAAPGDDPYLLPRIRVDGSTSPATLVQSATSARPS